ncbi:MAG TPA: Gfo/Idh/MocA family oxidoreductase [Methylomirabilota bacterium]|nr:Gfo/Idh/MocA family oxidoreductase [Methylomirabilota bacterium]
MTSPLPRRSFLQCILGAGATFALGGPLRAAEPNPPHGPLKAVIIGHTGRGNYGHDLDLAFAGQPGLEVVAVADPVEAGRAQAARRSGALRQYADYREMLERERPHLVSVAPRWTDQHHAMIRAALQAGAHVYAEKPFTRTLAEADELLALARSLNRRIAVAHQMRLAPAVLHLKRRIDEGLIGALLALHGHGKQDARAGGEDLVVLGTHVFDLMRFFAGEPQWCSASIRQQGREITLADARRATEDIGPVAGDEIEAQFAFASGVTGSFTSRARLRDTAGPWGLHLLGSKGTVRVLMDIFPRVYLKQTGAWSSGGADDAWRPLADDPGWQVPESERGFFHANRRVVSDWLEAIRQGREPVCSGAAATGALEMAMAIFAAGLSRSRVQFPLARRTHPLDGE